jgi:NTE family protein
MIRRGLTICLVLIFISANVLPVRAQQPQTSKRRKTVGLVLSGGGARGFAHVGVLKVLEENHIPVDYVAGASMGGLIGSMYAMGHTPAEMEALISELNWDQLLTATTTFENLSFRRKEDRRNIPAPITLKGRINDLKLPNALNSGHEAGLLFDRVALPYAQVRDFHDLPIPFACVGTDMVKGESVTLDKGSLSRALRATMSVPGVFAPVEIDGRILSDGGLVNNIPTNVVKAMSADIVLVVNIETQLAGRESLESILGVLAQTINIASADNSRRSLLQADMIIAPDLGKYSNTDFGEAKAIIDLGYQGAEAKVGMLRNLSLNDADWQAHLAARRARELPDSAPVPEFLAVDGKNQDAVRTIEEKLGDKYKNQPLTPQKQEELAKDLSDLTGTGRFDSLDYDVISREGKPGLLIRTTTAGERPSKPTRLEVGFDVNSVESDNVNFVFNARLTFFDIGRYGSEWRNDVKLGSNTLLASEYYRPLARTKFFIAPRISYERRRINLFSGSTRLAEYVGANIQAGIDVGYMASQRSEFRAGYTIGYESASRRIGDPLLPNVEGSFSNASLRWNYDGLDKAQVPNHGLYSRNSVTHYFDSPDAVGRFSQAETRSNIFFPLNKVNKRTTGFAFGGGGATFGGEAPLIRQFTLGGPFRLGGYGYEEFRASNYIQGGAGFLYNPEIFPSFLGGKAYVGAWYEGGSAFEKIGNANYRQSISGGAILETPLGPVFLGGSMNENGRGRFYFSFGRIFR